jgi:hypothetical protein
MKRLAKSIKKESSYFGCFSSSLQGARDASVSACQSPVKELAVQT